MKDLANLIESLESSYSALKSVDGKDVCIMIGSHGSGGTTLLRYLDNVAFELSNQHGAFQQKLRVVDEASIFENRDYWLLNEGVYPKVTNIHSSAGEDYHFVELGDLLGSGIESVGAHALTKSVKNIKSILFILDVNDIIHLRGMGFREKMIQWASILRDNPESNSEVKRLDNLESVRFIITKAEKGTSVESFIDEIVKPTIDSLQKEGVLSDDDDLLLSTLVYLDNHRDQVLIPDVTDNGESRELIFSSLDSSVALEPESFNFLHMDSHEHVYKKLMIEDSLESRARSIEKNKLHLQEAETGNTDLGSLKEESKRTQSDLFDEMRKLGAKISVVKWAIEQNQRKLLQDLDVSTPMLWEQRSINHAQEFEKNYPPFIRRMITFNNPSRRYRPATGIGTYHYDNFDNLAPGNIVEVAIKISNDNAVTSKNVKRSGNRFEATISYQKGMSFDGQIDVYVEKRAFPEVREQINTILEENKALNDMLVSYQLDAARLQNELYTFRHQYLDCYSQACEADQENVELEACDTMYANTAWPLPGVGAIGGDCVLVPLHFPFAEGFLDGVNAIRAPMGYERVEGAQMFGRFAPEVDVAAQFLLLSVLYTAFKWGYEAMKKCFHVSESSEIKVNMFSGNQHGMFSHEEINANDEALNVMPLRMNA